MSEIKFKGRWFAWEKRNGGGFVPVVYYQGILAAEDKRIVAKWEVTLEEIGRGFEYLKEKYPMPEVKGDE